MLSNPHDEAVKIAEYLVGKNMARTKAFESNLDIQKLLANIFVKAEQFAKLNNVSVQDITIREGATMTPSGKKMTWQFCVNPNKRG